MTENDFWDWGRALALIGVIVLAFMAGVYLASYAGITQAIAHHAMHYDPSTGKPVWNDEVKP